MGRYGGGTNLRQNYLLMFDEALWISRSFKWWAEMKRLVCRNPPMTPNIAWLHAPAATWYQQSTHWPAPYEEKNYQILLHKGAWPRPSLSPISSWHESICTQRRAASSTVPRKCRSNSHEMWRPGWEAVDLVKPLRTGNRDSWPNPSQLLRINSAPRVRWRVDTISAIL